MPAIKVVISKGHLKCLWLCYASAAPASTAILLVMVEPPGDHTFFDHVFCNSLIL